VPYESTQPSIITSSQPNYAEGEKTHLQAKMGHCFGGFNFVLLGCSQEGQFRLIFKFKVID
jgi:hypothetical protein